MKAEKVYNFFFHPFSADHTTEIKAFSSLTIFALGILTAGTFFVVFGIVNWRDRKITKNAKNPKAQQVAKMILDPSSKEKIERVKNKNAEQVQLFQKWASQGDWVRFRPEHSHYDWWAFPISRPSAGHGDDYAVNQHEIEALKADEEFMRNYKKGVDLVVKSWGWDLNQDAPVSPDIKTNDQEWTGYGVRLGKMADSLRLFGEDELYRRLQHFFDAICVPIDNQYRLEDWVYKNLERTKADRR